MLVYGQKSPLLEGAAKQIFIVLVSYDVLLLWCHSLDEGPKWPKIWNNSNKKYWNL